MFKDEATAAGRRRGRSRAADRKAVGTCPLSISFCIDDKKSPQDRNSPARRRALHPQGLRGWQRGTRADCEATQEKTLSAPTVLAVGFKQAQEEGFLRQFAHMETHTNPLQLSSVARILSHTALHLEILDLGLHRVHSQLISDRLNVRSAARGHCARSSNRCRRFFAHLHIRKEPTAERSSERFRERRRYSVWLRSCHHEQSKNRTD